jgi:branched-chain amino acid transport system substrate-binding protein
MPAERKGIRFRSLFVVMLLCVSCFCTACWSADPVKIGYCVSLAGVYSALGQDLVDGINLYMFEINHKAGGRDIEVIVQNISSAQVTLALDTVFKLIDTQKINILAGVVDSRVAYAVAPLAAQHGLPFVISNAGADDLTQRKADPFIIRTSFSGSGGSHPMGAWAYEQGFRKAVAIGPDNPAGLEQVGGMCRTFTELGGKIMQEIWPPLGTQDFKPFLAAINPEADVVMVFFAGGDALRFVQQYAESGLKGKVALIGKGDLVDERLLGQQGAAADGIVSVLHWSLLLDTPENTRFKEAFTKKYGRAPTQFAEQGYVTGMAIAKALNETKGEVRGKDFVKTMRSLELNAPRGTIKFDEYGSPIQAYYIRKTQPADGGRQNAISKTYPAVSQFWTWKAPEFMAMPTYLDMKGKWISR